ncbi:MAG TPA: 5-formyltetrahydrofolate cyclo-ligase [Usitatibacter sp.]|jgi:5-formyltetrahydrofolate cyclo-ligase|nr:5-formyltetrahydrofolate cyclo-ligase [Usitatibacter sp.]
MKAELRKKTIARRDAIPAGERQAYARALTAHLEAMPEYRDAVSVLTTSVIGSEWNTGPLMKRALAAGKRIVLPRVGGSPKRLEIFEVADLRTDLKPGVWDILEPDPERCRRVELADVDFAVVPALLADPAGYRLGYGAGYFDGLLAGRGVRPLCVIALPARFIVESVPREPHDVPVDRVIDETGRVYSRREAA